MGRVGFVDGPRETWLRRRVRRSGRERLVVRVLVLQQAARVDVRVSFDNVVVVAVAVGEKTVVGRIQAIGVLGAPDGGSVLIRLIPVVGGVKSIVVLSALVHAVSCVVLAFSRCLLVIVGAVLGVVRLIRVSVIASRGLVRAVPLPVGLLAVGPVFSRVGLAVVRFWSIEAGILLGVVARHSRFTARCIGSRRFVHYRFSGTLIYGGWFSLCRFTGH